MLMSIMNKYFKNFVNKTICISAFFLLFMLFYEVALASEESGTFLVLSDFHYDATENITNSSSDTTPIIFSSLAQKISELSSTEKLTPDFIIIPGDFLAHDFGDKHQFNHLAIETAMVTPMEMLKASLLHIVEIIPAIGNNDYYCGDYCTDLQNIGSSGNFFFDIEKKWEPFICVDNAETDFSESFVHGGFYTLTPLKNFPHLKIIVLNDIPFAPINDNPHTDVDDKTYVNYIISELDYLEDRLMQYQKGQDKVFVIYHIPNFEFCQWNDFALGLQNKYGDNLLDILNKYRSSIAAIISGHTHLNLLNSIPQKNLESILSENVGSIAPTFVPTFNVFHYNRQTGAIDQNATEIYQYDVQSNIWHVL